MATMVGSWGISAGSPLEQDFYKMKSQFPSLPRERCQQLPSGGTPSRLAQHHISEVSEALSAGHWVLKGLTHFAGMVCVSILVVGSNPAFSWCCKTSLGVVKTGLGATPSLGDSDTAVNTVGKASQCQLVSANLPPPAPDLI